MQRETCVTSILARSLLAEKPQLKLLLYFSVSLVVRCPVKTRRRNEALTGGTVKPYVQPKR